MPALLDLAGADEETGALRILATVCANQLYQEKEKLLPARTASLACGGFKELFVAMTYACFAICFASRSVA